MKTTSQPPRTAAILLARLLDAGSRESVCGDLHEGYVTIRSAHGTRRAWWWYWTHAVRSIVACRITGQRRAAERRLDYAPGRRPSLQDVMRPALRQFRDHPLYAITSAGTLALAVGAACVSFAVVKRALVDPLPYRESHQLVSLLTLKQ